MTVHKRFTNSSKTKSHWGFIVSVQSNEFDSAGNPKRKQKAKWGFKTKKEALDAEREFLNNLDKGKVEFNKDSTFSDITDMFFKHMEIEHYSEGTISNYNGYCKNHLQMFANVKVSKLNRIIIKEWYNNARLEGKSCHIINGCIKFLKASFNYAIKEEKITCNPFEFLEEVDEPEVLRNRFSTKQLRTLIKSCYENMPEFYCIFILATCTGMRLGEYSALTKDDINFENLYINVDKQYTRRKLKAKTKTKKSTRQVKISRMVAEVIKWHIVKFNIFNGLLFKGKYDNPVSENWVNNEFDKLLVLNGFPKDFCRVHDLRGQFVDTMHSIGAPVKFISGEVGHARTSTTNDIYSKILNEVKDDAMDSLDKKIFG